MANITITVEKIKYVNDGLDHVTNFLLAGSAGRKTKAIVFTSDERTRSDVYVRLLTQLPSSSNVGACSYLNRENQPFEEAEFVEVDFCCGNEVNRANSNSQ